MTEINTNSIGIGAHPRVYANKIILRPGTSTDFRREAETDRGSATQASKNSEGDIAYTTDNQQSAVRTSTAPLKAELQVYIQDIGRGTWLNSSLLRKNLVLRIVQSANSQLTKDLLDNNFNLLELEKYNRNQDYQIIEMGLARQDIAKDKIYSYMASDKRMVHSLVKSVEFNRSTTPQHLTYFYTTFSLPEEGSTDEVRGPVTVERVLEKSMVVESSFALQDTPDSVWAGPAHFHRPSGWMEGYTHVSTPHQKLIKSVVNNFKVIDLRAVGGVSNLSIELHQSQNNDNTSYVSDFYLARNASGHAAAIFSVDYFNFLADRSRYGNLFRQAPSEIKDQILARCEILSLEIKRTRVKSKTAANRLESTAQVLDTFSDNTSAQPIIKSLDSSGRLVTLRKYAPPKTYTNFSVDVMENETPPDGYEMLSSIEELNVDRSRRTRSFAINDTMLGITDGVYRYSAEMRIKDGSYLFLSQKLNELNEAISAMQNYIGIARTPSNYDSRTNRFTRSFINSQLNSDTFLIPNSSEGMTASKIVKSRSDNRKVQVWLGAIIKYIELLSFLTGISQESKDRLARTLYCMSSPVTGTPEMLEEMVELMQSLQSQVMSLVHGQKARHTRDQSDAYQPSRATETLSINALFSETFDSNVLRSTGFDYFGSANGENGILKIQQKRLSEVINLQLNNLTNNLYNIDFVKNNFDFLPGVVVDALYSRKTELSYLSPASIQVAGNKISLWSNDSLDYISLTAIIQNMVRKSTGKLINMQPSSTTLGLLKQFGKGSSQERLKNINRLYIDNAIASGVVLEGLSPLLSSAANNGLESSTAPLGETNKFTSATPGKPDLTTPAVPDNLEDILSVLDRILEVENLSLSLSLQATSPLNISFDLRKQNNFLVRSIRPNSDFVGEKERHNLMAQLVAALPQHIKLLTLNSGRFYDDTAGALSTNDDSKTDGFMYNFGLIRVIEYLASYGAGGIKDPVWKKLEPSDLTPSSAYKICRVRKITDAATNIGIYDVMDRVPVFNEYFLLRGPRLRAPAALSAKRPAYLSEDMESYSKGAFAASSERGIFLRLLNYQGQEKMLDTQIEYTVTEAALPPSGDRRVMPSTSQRRAMRSSAPTARATSPQPRASAPTVRRGGY